MRDIAVNLSGNGLSGSDSAIAFAGVPSAPSHDDCPAPANTAAEEPLTTRKHVNANADSERQLAAIVDLLTRLDGYQSPAEAANEVCRACASLVDATWALLGWRQAGICHRLGTYSEAESASAESLDQFAEAAFHETLARNAVSIWPPEEAAERHCLLAIKQLSSRLAVESILSLPLADAGGTVRGVLVVGGSQATLKDRNAERLLTTLAVPAATKLHALEKLQPDRVSRFMKAVRAELSPSRRRGALWIITLALLVALLPIPYRIPGEVQVAPTASRMIAAPFDGNLREVLVQPGELVQRGTLLAQMDDREIALELAEIEKNIGQAEQQRSGHLATHEFGKAELLRLERERLRLRGELLQQRRENLDIRSPVEGIIVDGDVQRAEGAPLSVGQTLFEIAALDVVTLEIAIEEEDILRVVRGMPASVRLAAGAGEVRGTIDRIRPQSEIRDERNVFVATIEVPNSERLWKPGMRGKAFVRSGYRPLAWTLLHKPFRRLRLELGW